MFRCNDRNTAIGTFPYNFFHALAGRVRIRRLQDNGFFRVRAVEFGIARPVESDDGNVLTDSHVHGAAVVSNKKAAPPHGRRQLADGKLPGRHDGL